MNITNMREVCDFFLNCVLNVWNVFKQVNPAIFAILVALCLNPILNRIVRSIRGGK